MGTGKLKRPKSMPVGKEIDENVELIEKVRKKLEDRKANHEKNVNSAFAMVKKFKSKELPMILNEQRVLIPREATENLKEKVSLHEKNIEKNSHASASSKLKNMLGVNAEEGSKEDKRRKQLTNDVIDLGTTLDAYLDFFMGCSNAKTTLNPFLVKFNNIITKLGPKGKGYIVSELELRQYPSWNQMYTDKLSSLCGLYCFAKASDNKIKHGYNQLISCFHDETKTCWTSYRERVKMVYAMYRDLASAIKLEIENEFAESFDKLQTANNSYGATNNTLLDHFYKIVKNEIQAHNEKIATLTKFIFDNSKIFSDPQNESRTNDLLEKANTCVTNLKTLSESIAHDAVISTMTTTDENLNVNTKSLINAFDALLFWLRTLKIFLLRGDHNNAENTYRSFRTAYQTTKTMLENYKQTITTIDSNRNDKLQMTFTQTQKQLQEIKSTLATNKTKLDTCINMVERIPTNFKQNKINTIITYATTVIGSCSMVLGPYTSILSKLVSGFGPTVGMKVADMYYAN